MSKFLGQSIKANTIFIFGLLTMILIAIMACISYVSVKSIYLQQVHEQVTLLNKITASNLDLRFLDFISPESESAGLRHYRNQLLKTTKSLQLSDVFIFDSSGTVLINTGQEDTKAGLMLNQQEIRKLEIGQSFNSLPFKSDDRQWYLWNFRRLNEKYFLGVRENTQRLAEVDKLANGFIGIAVLGLMLVLVAGWFVGRSVAEPVNKLVAFSSEMGKGNLQAVPPEGIRGELAVLQNALIQMRNDLANHQQEKENMLAQIAHELRNPLGGISLLAGLIKEDPELGSKNAEYAQRISEETEGLKNQISAYLNFSKPLTPETETISIESFLTSLQNEFVAKLQKQNIELKLEIDADTVRFDTVHLRQILSNLIDNSARAIGENGVITVYAENKHLSISDNGPGILVENLTKVFEPFYTTSTEGAGLGLAICRKLCNENEATISVENNMIEGCTFTIKFGLG